jgi:endonuclease/exonuclease/phosphatase family metal-dependent hydrolase
MKLLTWNIQWGLGMDGQVDLARIAREIRRLADADVICLQEVTEGFDDLKGNDGADQFAALAALFPDYAAISFAAVDMPRLKDRKRFGNMILSRLPVGQVLRHTLPWDSDGVECMPRGCLEIVVKTVWGPMRVMTTHLEWSSSTLRGAQVEALREAQRLSARRANLPPTEGKGPYKTGPNSVEALLCGDFNMQPDHPLVARLQAPAEAGVPAFRDAWRVCERDAAHPPSMCLFDQADGTTRCLDYVFVTEGLASRLKSTVYDQTSGASDHQAVIIELA